MSDETNTNEEVMDAPEGADINLEGDSDAPESIGLQDLQLLAQIVDLASQRGAFRGNELTQVGGVFDKLTVFLQYVADKQAEAAEGAEGEAEAPAEAPAEGE